LFSVSLLYDHLNRFTIPAVVFVICDMQFFTIASAGQKAKRAPVEFPDGRPRELF